MKTLTATAASNRNGRRGTQLPWLVTRGLTALACVAMLTVLLGGMARADNVVNTVVVGSTDTTVVANGIDSITVGYAIVAANDQTQSGSTETGNDPNTSLCNVADASHATVTINVPAGVTSSHRSLTFTACGVYQYVTFTATTSAAVNVSVSVADADKLDYYSNQAAFTLSTTSANTAPTLAVPASFSVEAVNASGAYVTFNATANDAEQGVLTPTCTPASGATFPLGTTTVNCSVTDNGGLTATGSFTVTVVDSTLPTLSLPASQTLEATSAAGAVASFSASASDSVSGTLDVTCDATSGSTFSLGTTTVACSATDGAGNTATGSFKVTVQDKTAPAFGTLANLTREATGPGGAAVTYAITATDAVSGTITATCSPASESVFALGTHTVSCTATDGAGNTSSAATFTVTVRDTTNPAFGTLDNIVAEATSADGAAVTFNAPIASDAVSGSITATCLPASGSTFALQSAAHTVACSATDKAGNTGTGTFTVTVRDTTAPAFTNLENLRREATGPSGALVTFGITASDAVDATPTVACDPSTGSTFGLGETTVDCTATDASNNVSMGSFTVTVRDTTPPMIADNDDVTVEATSGDGATYEFDVPAASDIVSGTLTATCLPASGETFPLGTTKVTCTATDGAGLSSTSDFTVTVRDTTAPALTVPTGLTIEATKPTGAVVTYSATATDLVSTPTVVCTPASGTTFGLGNTVVSCTATDTAGNAATKTFTVKVEDTTNPTIDPITNITVEATSAAGANVSFTIDATDRVDQDLTISCSPAAASTFALGDTLVTCTATDNFDNVETMSFTVTVEDTTAPAFGTLANLTKEATAPGGAAATYTITATDAVSGSITATCSPVSGSTFALGTHTVSCTATDAAGNTSEPGTFTVTVRDTTAPALTVPASFSVAPTSATGATVTYSGVSATDEVDLTVTITCSPASGTAFAIGGTLVTCTATDDAGNVTTKSFTVTVNNLRITGYYQPVDMNGVLNTVKAGSTVPLKFEIFAGNTELTATTGIQFRVSTVSCSSLSSIVDEIETLATTGGTSLRYDSTGGQFIQNWQTPKTAGICYRVAVYTGTSEATATSNVVVAYFKTR